MPFEPDAWLTDPGISACSLAAQGLWLRCLFAMFKNHGHRGYLEIGGKPATAEAIAKACGETPKRIRLLLDELEKNGVFSRDPSGTIYNRRMIRDQERRDKAVRNGKKGGNPLLKSGAAENEADESAAVEKSVDRGSEKFHEERQPHEPDWLVVEAEFLRRWNGLDGVIKQSGNALPYNLVRDFHEAWLTPKWWERAEEAMRKFPLKNGVKMGLRKFLIPTTIDEIIGGSHDWEPGKSRGRKGRGARSALEREFGGRMDEIDEARTC